MLNDVVVDAEEAAEALYLLLLFPLFFIRVRMMRFFAGSTVIFSWSPSRKINWLSELTLEGMWM
ncbi:MAG: hypothetical protein QXI19_00325 [Candidatus Caldarchaeum sp.]